MDEDFQGLRLEEVNSNLQNFHLDLFYSLIALKLPLIYLCLIGFICSALLKTSQGSSTSSMIIVSSIIFPIISDFSFSVYELTMIILSIGSGSMMISHVNDSYFWIVTKQTDLNLSKGLKYFSLMTIIQSIGTFLFIFSSPSPCCKSSSSSNGLKIYESLSPALRKKNAQKLTLCSKGDM